MGKAGRKEGRWNFAVSIYGTKGGDAAFRER